MILSILALLVFLACIGTALGVFSAANLLWWILTFLALIVLLSTPYASRLIGPRLG
jgi:endonuclease/exonuclease/phosphatase (EEP) superfamily protein YafD